MGAVIPFACPVAPEQGDASTSPTFDRAKFRTGIENAARACMDMAERLVELLDRIDGDPDYEPDADDEDDGSDEPLLASFIGALSQVRWVGFDGGAA